MAYTSNYGDIFGITLNPEAGHAQAGRRPALVLSPAAYITLRRSMRSTNTPAIGPKTRVGNIVGMNDKPTNMTNPVRRLTKNGIF